MRTRYVILFSFVIKSFAVYVADIYTAVTLLAFNRFNGSIYQRVENSSDNLVPITYSKWIFFGCIIFSFLLLLYESHKSRAIIRSRDISYAYTNVMANNYYSIRSYDHHCFFSQINNSTKKKDEIAFFIFFTFKGWKRLIVADGPRQVINALTLYGLVEVSNFSTNVEDYYGGNILTGIMLLTMIFTVVVFAGSAILLGIAALMYLPLLCYIKGNLKEYCCHKIDKRITELVQVKKKERVAKQAAIARAEAKGDFKHLMNKKGVIVGQKMAQPTLPQVDVDLFEKSAAGVGHGPLANALYRNKAGHPVYQHRPRGGDSEYGSQAQLVMNQGQGGGNESMSYINGSVDDFGGMAPSLPPSVHNSPDSYPMHVKGRGIGGMPNDASTARLMAQLGPIGTSPQLMAQRAVGDNGLMSPSRSYGQMNGDATSSTYRGPDAYNNGVSTAASNASLLNGSSAVGGYTRSPLAVQDSSRYNGSRDAPPSHYKGRSPTYDSQMQQQQAQQYEDSYWQNESASQQQADPRAYTGDLSAYAPYDPSPGGGAGVEVSPYPDVLQDIYAEYHSADYPAREGDAAGDGDILYGQGQQNYSAAQQQQQDSRDRQLYGANGGDGFGGGITSYQNPRSVFDDSGDTAISGYTVSKKGPKRK